MARTYGKILTRIWDPDDDFVRLTHGAQWLYEALVTDPALTLAGSLPWQPRKLARRSADTTAVDVERWAAELVAARFILLDEDTEEVLIRSFIWNDGGARNPNIRKATEHAVARIESRDLRTAGQLGLSRATTNQQVERRDDPVPNGIHDPIPDGTPDLPEACSLQPEAEACSLKMNPAAGTADSRGELAAAGIGPAAAAAIDLLIDHRIEAKRQKRERVNPKRYIPQTRAALVAQHGPALAREHHNADPIVIAVNVFDMDMGDAIRASARIHRATNGTR